MLMRRALIRKERNSLSGGRNNQGHKNTYTCALFHTHIHKYTHTYIDESKIESIDS